MSMLDTLITNLQTIHTEAMTKLIPSNIKQGITIYGVTGTLSTVKTFATVAAMNASTGNVEDDMAIVYGTTYVGTYRYDGGAWTQIGDSTQEQQIMDTLNAVLGPIEQYEGNGGTDTEINTVLDNILGIEEVQ